MVLGKEQALAHLAQTPIAFLGTVTDVIPGISTRSMPPINHYRLRFQHIRPLRGSVSASEFSYQQQGAGLLRPNLLLNLAGSAASWNNQTEEETKEPTVGVTYLACSSDGQHINTLVELDDNTIEKLLQSSKIPIGWSQQPNGRYESPWQHAHTKKVKWYDHQRFAGNEKCAKSGRPLLLTTDDITLSCEPVHAAHTKEYQNPDGDGMKECFSSFFVFICPISGIFKLTVTNNSNHPVEIPALVCDSHSRKILWEESVFVITDAGNHFFPAHGQARDVAPVVLQPHESVSAQLDTLTLHGLSWPQGGWRIELRFCLGDKAVEGNYYYFTDHHDPIRKKSAKKKTAMVD